MTAQRPYFDVEALRAAAGEKVFARGVAYRDGEQVEITAINGTRVLARVIGSEIYRTEISGRDGEFSGHCSCPAFSDRGFCKHLVATGLAANAVEPGRADEAANRLTRIRDHLRAQGVEMLVETIMRLAERDPTLLADLELAAATDEADDETLFARFRKAITEATRTGDFLAYGEVRDWAERVDRVLDQVEGLVDRGRAEAALRLLDHFLARMETALSSVDDSAGHAGEVFARARDIHLAACREATPDPIALARDLFARETGSDWGFFGGASGIYADVLREAGLAEYRRLAEEAWSRIKPLAGGDRPVHGDRSGDRYRLMAILDGFAERDGDLDARIALRAKDLSSPYAYLRIAELCLAHGREAEALRWAEEGLWLFDSSPDERLVTCAADLYRRTGRREKAEELLWQAFERHPNLDTYERLKALVHADSAAAEAAADKAIGVLKARIAAEAGQARSYWWSSPPDVLVRLLMAEGRLAEAWDAARAHRCSDQALEALAQASEERHPAQALAAYAELVERLVRATERRAYEEACRILDRMGDIRDRRSEGAAHAAHLADLMTRYKAKRTFVKLLRSRSPDGP